MRKGEGMTTTRANAMVERRVRVYWPMEDAFYAGTVAAWDGDTGQHHIIYDDGEMIWDCLWWEPSRRAGFELIVS